MQPQAYDTDSVILKAKRPITCGLCSIIHSPRALESLPSHSKHCRTVTRLYAGPSHSKHCRTVTRLHAGAKDSRPVKKKAKLKIHVSELSCHSTSGICSVSAYSYHMFTKYIGCINACTQCKQNLAHIMVEMLLH